MNTASQHNSSAISGTSGRLVADSHDFTCRCCDKWIEGSPCWEFRHGDWLCPRCWKLISVMDEMGEFRAGQAVDFMKQEVSANRWQR